MLGYLKEGDRDNQGAVDEAYKKYEADFNQSPENPVVRNDFSDFYPDPKDRESMRETF